MPPSLSSTACSSILYAEDRDLLPVRDERYDDYGLRDKVRGDVGRRKDRGDAFSETAARYWSAIDDLCRAVDAGDSSIGLPPYDGGLFDRESAPLLSRINFKDIVFLTQNLYTLGGFLVDERSPIAEGPLKPILDRVARQIIQRVNPRPSSRATVQVQLAFRTPRFQLEPDLNDKRIRVVVEVNGRQEKLVFGYEDFFSNVAEAHGEMKLNSSLSRDLVHRRPTRYAAAQSQSR